MRALCALLLVAVATPARAGVVVGEGVPFSADELERALAARTPASAGLALDVQAIAPDRLRVVGASGRWDVELGEARGRAAARLVALNVLGSSDAGAVAPVGPAPARGLGVTLVAGASRGVGGDDLASTVTGLELIGGGRWWLGAGFEWRGGVEATAPGAEPVDARAWLVRALVGRTVGPVEVAAGPLLGGLRVDSSPVAEAWLVGVGGVVRARCPLAARWSLVGAVGADAYRHRVEVRRAGQVVAATPRVALAATLGLRWELGR